MHPRSSSDSVSLSVRYRTVKTPSERDDPCFTSDSHVSYMVLLWPTLSKNHRGKGVLGKCSSLLNQVESKRIQTLGLVVSIKHHQIPEHRWASFWRRHTGNCWWKTQQWQKELWTHLLCVGPMMCSVNGRGSSAGGGHSSRQQPGPERC